MTKHSCRDMVPKPCGLTLPCRLYFCSGCSGITTIGKSEDIRKTSVCKHMQDESEQSVPVGIVLALYMRNSVLAYKTSSSRNLVIGRGSTSWPLVEPRIPHVFYGLSRCLPNVHPQQSGIPLLRYSCHALCYNARARPHHVAMYHSRNKKVVPARTISARAPANTYCQAPRR
ncbi:hypothetical protein GE21DRAFT_1034668 [Neurospora crassa]|nr:hypothetical protein GE21DRAFT_1034668 [Neurospora crassa]